MPNPASPAIFQVRLFVMHVLRFFKAVVLIQHYYMLKQEVVQDKKPIIADFPWQVGIGPATPFALMEEEVEVLPTLSMSYLPPT